VLCIVKQAVTECGNEQRLVACVIEKAEQSRTN